MGSRKVKGRVDLLKLTFYMYFTIYPVLWHYCLAIIYALLGVKLSIYNVWCKRVECNQSPQARKGNIGLEQRNSFPPGNA